MECGSALRPGKMECSRILFPSIRQIILFNLQTNSNYYYILRSIEFIYFALSLEIFLLQINYILQRLLRDRSNQRRYRSIFTLLIKERYTIYLTISILRSTSLFLANNYKKRLKLLEYIEIDINRFLIYNNLYSLRISYSIANRLILLLVEINFDLRYQYVIAIN